MLTRDRVGRYALVRPIARGGMAEVWAGKAYGSGGFEKPVAIKLLARHQTGKELYHKALLDEALVQVHLKHPNIIDVYDLNIEGENPYLVMEYVEGVELWAVLRALKRRGQALPPALACYIIKELAGALAFAHARCHPETGAALQIVHRDVSPSNVLLSRQGEVKLSDFGIAKSILQSGVTQAGQLKGKYRYMSPEQARGEALNGRSDIFSLGLVFYECLTGEPAYLGDVDMELLRKAQQGLIHYPQGLELPLQDILQGLLAEDPLRRTLEAALTINSPVANAQDLSRFLNNLQLAELNQAGQLAQALKNWQQGPESMVLESSGRLSTVAMTALPARAPRRWVRWLLAPSLLALALLFGWWWQQGLLTTAKTPEPALRTSLVPDSHEVLQPVAAAASPKPTPELRVQFSAEPYAEVTVPGQFAGLETPIKERSLPRGHHQVSFFHPPSGQRATATLSGAEGGTYRCTARLSISVAGQKPQAACQAL